MFNFKAHLPEVCMQDKKLDTVEELLASLYMQGRGRLQRA